MEPTHPDHAIQVHRAQIAAQDLKILEALNTRIDLVKRLRAFKETQGLPFHDAAQEDRLLAALREANQGPLPDEGVEEVFRLILAWTKRATAGSEAAPED
jgi:chorismate mutase